MSHYEDLGTGLGLLSLDDVRRHEVETNHAFHTSHDEGDAMDIDSVSDLSEQDIVLQEADDGETENASEDEENTLIMNILSPTSLGVQYALKQRLLMPPPDKDTNHRLSDLDYVYDTSMAVRSGAVNLPNRSTFEPVAVTSLFNESPMDSSILVEEPEVYENSMNRSFQYRRQMAPASYSVVHHHHYYGGQNGAQTGFQAYPGSVQSGPGLAHSGTMSNSEYAGYHPTFQKQSFQDYAQGPVIGYAVGSNDGKIGKIGKTREFGLINSGPGDIYTGHYNHGERYPTRHGHFLSKDLVLPSPWDSHATPAERTPYLFSLYLQLLINICLSVYAGHLLVTIVRTIKQDIDYKLETEANNLLVEIALCERSYYENNCQPETIVPALEKMCGYWEKCMNQDPFRGGNKSLMSAHTIAMIINLLIEPLSFKVLVVFALAMVLVFVSNFAFGYVRAKTYYGWGPSGNPTE